MKVLFVAPEFPLPAHSGGQVATLETLRSLAPRCEIHLLVPPPERDADALRALLPDVRVHFYRSGERRGLAMYATAALAALARRSYWELSWQNRALRSAVERLHAAERFDVVHCEWLKPAVSLRRLDLPLVIRTLDIHFLVMESWAKSLPRRAGLRRRYWLGQSNRFRPFEVATLAAAQSVITLSREDEEVLRGCGLRNIVTIPPPRPAEPVSQGTTKPIALFIGRLDMAPNREAFFEFADDVWPLVSREVRARVRVIFAGGFPDDATRRRAAERGIEIRGPLADAEVADLFRDAALFLSPIRSGTGIKIKTLDAMAHGKAILGFPGAFRGVPVENGVHASIAGTPAEFARMFKQLMADEPRRSAIGSAARDLIRTTFDPTLLGARLADVYRTVQKPLSRESAFVRLVRAGFRRWPFPRGSGLLLRLSRLVLGKKPVTFDVGDGTYIEGNLDDWMILWLFVCGHEKDESFQRSLKLVRPNGVAIDVGAHVGVWSLLAATRVPSARIHAFEPVPERVERFRAHAQQNEATGIVINPCVAGAENGAFSFFVVHEGNTGASSLVRRAASDVEIRVPMVTLDTYVAQNTIDRVDVIKVDVEGAEILVFKGAAKLLSGDDAPAIFFEADDKLSASFGVSTRQTKELLARYGYFIYRWRDGKFASVSIEEPHGHEDLFALKHRDVAQMRIP